MVQMRLCGRRGGQGAGGEGPGERDAAARRLGLEAFDAVRRAVRQAQAAHHALGGERGEVGRGWGVDRHPDHASIRAPRPFGRAIRAVNGAPGLHVPASPAIIPRLSLPLWHKVLS